jgi:hypothetical protein
VTYRSCFCHFCYYCRRDLGNGIPRLKGTCPERIGSVESRCPGPHSLDQETAQTQMAEAVAGAAEEVAVEEVVAQRIG